MAPDTSPASIKAGSYKQPMKKASKLLLGAALTARSMPWATDPYIATIFQMSQRAARGWRACGMHLAFMLHRLLTEAHEHRQIAVIGRQVEMHGLQMAYGINAL